METSGGSFVTLVHPEDRCRVDKDIRDQISGSPEKLDFVNYRIVRKNGSLRRVEEFGHRVHELDGQTPPPSFRSPPL